jgi:hypothetical protein
MHPFPRNGPGLERGSGPLAPCHRRAAFQTIALLFRSAHGARPLRRRCVCTGRCRFVGISSARVRQYGLLSAASKQKEQRRRATTRAGRLLLPDQREPRTDTTSALLLPMCNSAVSNATVRCSWRCRVGLTALRKFVDGWLLCRRPRRLQMTGVRRGSCVRRALGRRPVAAHQWLQEPGAPAYVKSSTFAGDLG